MKHDCKYLGLLNDILNNGEIREDRTGTGTKSIFGTRMEFTNLDQFFPLLTTKKLHWNSIVWELIWFLEGRTNATWLHDRNVTIWDEWQREDGELGPIYGKQWRSWTAADGSQVDQLQQVIETIKTNPTDRRMIVSAWNVGELHLMALPPCHLLYQFYVTSDGRLDCQMYQRSVDAFLGLPFNIASYALLIHIIAYITDLTPGKLVWIGGDTHLYKNHINQTREQLARTLKQSPRLEIRKEAPKTLEGWYPACFRLIGYEPHPHIYAPISV